uniref:Uncharacterized protein n=1 Tax=Sphaerodactylus townsendi TaxID=933632 RepID=A0ACB8FT74_9SAUR
MYSMMDSQQEGDSYHHTLCLAWLLQECQARPDLGRTNQLPQMQEIQRWPPPPPHTDSRGRSNIKNWAIFCRFCAHNSFTDPDYGPALSLPTHSPLSMQRGRLGSGAEKVRQIFDILRDLLLHL